MTRRLSPHALVAAAVLAAHLTVLPAGYVQDDHLVVESNPIVERGDPVEILGSAYWEGIHPVSDFALWRPLPILSYALERRVAGGPSPALAHLLNLLLHAAAASGLLALARRHGAPPGPALLGALLFALHPAKSEAVFNVVGRAEILAGLFGLAALLLHARARRGSGPRARLAAWGAGLALLLALSSKETAFAFVPLLLLQDLLLARAGERASVVHRSGALLPSLAAAAGALAARTLALEAFLARQPIQPFDNPAAALPFLERLPTALAVAARAAALFAFPVSLSNDHSGGSVPIEPAIVALRPLAGAAVLLALLAFLAVPFVRRDGRGRLAALAAGAVLFPWLVTGNLLVPVGALFAERFLYAPAIGVGLLLAAGLGAVPPGRGRRGAFAAASALLVLLGTRGLARGLDWKDDRTIFASARIATPESPRPPFVLGKLASDAIPDPRADRAAVDASVALFDRAISLWDDYPEAWKEKGVLLARSGRLAEGGAALEGAVRRGPASATALFNLGLVHQRTGRAVEAERAFRKAVLQDPGHRGAWGSLGHGFYDAGRFEEAASAYARAVALGREELRARLEDSRARALPGSAPARIMDP